MRVTLRDFQWYCLDRHVHEAAHHLWQEHLRVDTASPCGLLDTYNKVW